jgi:polyhydroxybutyrate depolymerase
MKTEFIFSLKICIVGTLSLLLISACGGGSGSGGSANANSSSGNNGGTPTIEIYPDSVTIAGSNTDENLGNYKIRNQGLNREFSFFRPANPELKKLPLVIDFHGASGIVAPVFRYDFWVALAKKENFLVLKPQAVSDKMNNYTYWNVGWDVGRNDVGFVQDVLDVVVKQQDVDIDRIYVTGMSSGGHMALFIAQALQDRIAAVAPISGSIMTTRLSNYSFNKPMPICNINGSADSVVNIEGGDWYASWKSILSLWIENNKVDSDPIITYLPDLNKSDGSIVTKYEYRGLTQASDIDDYRINGGNHSIPGIEPEANQDINAYEVIWAFFKEHTLNDPY